MVTPSFAGQWFDLLITSTSADGTVGVEPRTGAYASNYVPLWVGLAEPGSEDALAALAAFKASVGLRAVALAPECCHRRNSHMTSRCAACRDCSVQLVWPHPLKILVSSGTTPTRGLRCSTSSSKPLQPQEVRHHVAVVCEPCVALLYMPAFHNQHCCQPSPRGLHAGSEGKALAEDIAHRFLRTMHATWCSNTPFRHKMVEKWDASAVGGTGGGGEYRVQTGVPERTRAALLPLLHGVTLVASAQVLGGATG